MGNHPGTCRQGSWWGFKGPVRLRNVSSQQRPDWVSLVFFSSCLRSGI